MCGITAYLGSESAFEYILDSLILLQNRGYDSAGICTIDKNESTFNCTKYASNKENTAIELLQKYTSIHSENTVGLGHTRWATHGAKTDTNAHPHFDSSNRICVVHNGIIENYLEIKEKLITKGITFKSQTDTEVIPKLLGYYLEKEIERVGGSYDNIDFQNNVLTKTIEELHGTWAIVILFLNTPDKLYLCKNGSPLVLGVDNRFALISSEQLSLSKYFNNYITLNDGDIVTIEKGSDGVIRFPNRTNYIENVIQNKVLETSSYPYPHWTIKEICEQPMSIMRTLNMGGRLLGESGVKLGGLDERRELLLDIEHIILLGCGTSLNAAHIGCKIMQSLKCFNSVNCIDASEFTLDDIPNNGKTGFVLLSQSGETKDVHRCMELIRNRDFPIMAIVNVVGSLIARDSDCGIYLNAGREVGVASTKAFTSQIVALTLMSVWFSQNKNTCVHLRTQYIKNLRNLSLDVEQLLGSCMEKIRDIAKSIVNTHSMFLLGRGLAQFIANEGALKIKEIGYIHAEGYPGGSLKHGPFALIDKETVVILIAPKDDNFSKMINAAEEISSRAGRIILITNSGHRVDYKKELFESVITIPTNETLQCLLSVIPLQILAYEVALLKGHNPDFPKNLAKVVTVDG
jgi:glucosamine--fructose-6-phosphate aminotransferase (isomerizing)